MQICQPPVPDLETEAPLTSVRGSVSAMDYQSPPLSRARQ